MLSRRGGVGEKLRVCIKIFLFLFYFSNISVIHLVLLSLVRLYFLSVGLKSVFVMCWMVGAGAELFVMSVFNVYNCDLYCCGYILSVTTNTKGIS